MIINTKIVWKLIMLHLLLIPVFMFARSALGLPHGIFYLLDLMLCLELILVPRRLKDTLRAVKFRQLIPYLLLYTLFLLLTQLFHFESPVVSLMAYRRIYRFYIFYVVCMVLLRECDVEKILQMMLKLQVPNVVLTLYQCFVLKVHQDNMGGIFGTTVGVNAYTNVYLCVICIYVLSAYFSGKKTLKSVALVCGSSLMIGALAELKMFFLEMPMIVVLAMIFLRPERKQLKVLGIGVLEYAVAWLIFAKMYPAHAEVLTEGENFVSYTTEVIQGYNISRLNAFADINEIFFHGDILSNLFGYGFGNCESGSAFYEMYSSYNYTWFTHQVTFLETGYVGLFLYALFYVLVFFHAVKCRKKDPENKHYYVFTQIICVLCAPWLMYNQAMRMEPAYMIFFALATPAIVRKEPYLLQKEKEVT